MSYETIRILLDWCVDHGVKIDTRLDIQADAHGGIGVFTTEESISPGETVATIPRNAVLSARSCALSKYITPAYVGPEAQLTLALALYSELLLETNSEWYGYLQSLPDHIDLPICWDAWMRKPEHQPDLNAEDLEDIKDGLEWLRGTAAEKIFRQTIGGTNIAFEDIERYFQEVAQPLLTTQGNIPEQVVDLKGFLEAFCLVSSRAFMVDAYHGLAMVPIADAFNHVQEHNVHLETEHNVCSECGSFDECPHDRNIGEDSLRKHGVSEDPDYEMVVDVPIPPRSAVYNTYGETLSNAQLLCQHGFVLEANDNDVLIWTTDEVFDAVSCDSESLRTTVTRACSEYFADLEFMYSFPDSRCVTGYCEDLEGSQLRANADGQISIQLWILLLTLSAHQSEQVPALLDEFESRGALQSLYELHVALESQVDRLDDEDPSDYGGQGFLRMMLDCLDGGHLGVLKQGYRLLVQFFQARNASTGQRGHGDETDLVDLLDALDASKRRTRFSLMLAMNEKLILSSCEATWKDLLAPLEGAVV